MKDKELKEELFRETYYEDKAARDFYEVDRGLY